MKKKITVLAIVVFIAISITGCRFRPMSGFEVYKYVHSRTGRYLFTMSKEKVVEDGSAVNWTIHCSRDGLEFHVHDRLQFEIVYAERNLSDDYRYSLIQAHLDELDLGDGIEFVNENGYTFSDYDNYFSVYYSDYDDFVKKYERVTDNARLLDSYSSGLKIRYHFYYWPEERIEGEV